MNEKSEIEKKLQKYKDSKDVAAFFCILIVVIGILLGINSYIGGFTSFNHKKMGMDAFWDTIIFYSFLAVPFLIVSMSFYFHYSDKIFALEKSLKIENQSIEEEQKEKEDIS